MKKQKEIQHLNKLFKKMKQQWKAYVQTQSPESLHGFRVEVKKTKSYLSLLGAGGNEKLLKKFKPVKKIFKSTGIIRDAQMQQKQAMENHINAAQFYKVEDDVEQQESSKLLAMQHHYLQTIKRVNKQLRKRVHAVPEKKMAGFFRRQVLQVSNILNSHTFSEQLHDGRKIMKHLWYNRHMIPRAVVDDLHIDFKKIDRLQQVIGDWHDNKLALEFFADKLPAEALAPIQQKQENLQKVIIAQSKNLLQ